MPMRLLLRHPAEASEDAVAFLDTLLKSAIGATVEQLL
jgi:hypothetical protein